jgi:hypothetical protein
VVITYTQVTTYHLAPIHSETAGPQKKNKPHDGGAAGNSVRQVKDTLNRLFPQSKGDAVKQ